MKRFFTENKYYVMIIIAVILLITREVYAQPAPPSPPVGIVQWGNPMFYGCVVLGLGIYTLYRKRRRQ